MNGLLFAADLLDGRRSWPSEVQQAAAVVAEQLEHEQACDHCRGSGTGTLRTVLACVSGLCHGGPADEDLGGAVVEIATEISRSERRCAREGVEGADEVRGRG